MCVVGGLSKADLRAVVALVELVNPQLLEA